eukprot:629635-Amphidinium_carterae.1
MQPCSWPEWAHQTYPRVSCRRSICQPGVVQHASKTNSKGCDGRAILSGCLIWICARQSAIGSKRRLRTSLNVSLQAHQRKLRRRPPPKVTPLVVFEDLEYDLPSCTLPALVMLLQKYEAEHSLLCMKGQIYQGYMKGPFKSKILRASLAPNSAVVEFNSPLHLFRAETALKEAQQDLSELKALGWTGIPRIASLSAFSSEDLLQELLDVQRDFSLTRWDREASAALTTVVVYSLDPTKEAGF